MGYQHALYVAVNLPMALIAIGFCVVTFNSAAALSPTFSAHIWTRNCRGDMGCTRDATECLVASHPMHYVLAVAILWSASTAWHLLSFAFFALGVRRAQLRYWVLALLCCGVTDVAAMCVAIAGLHDITCPVERPETVPDAARLADERVETLAALGFKLGHVFRLLCADTVLCVVLSAGALCVQRSREQEAADLDGLAVGGRVPPQRRNEPITVGETELAGRRPSAVDAAAEVVQVLPHQVDDVPSPAAASD